MHAGRGAIPEREYSDRPKKNPLQIKDLQGVQFGGSSRIRTADLWIMIPSL